MSAHLFYSPIVIISSKLIIIVRNLRRRLSGSLDKDKGTVAYLLRECASHLRAGHRAPPREYYVPPLLSTMYVVALRKRGAP